ncbi:M23 family metallopeptidase [Psychromicrobium lacuslunae]|uniref:M23 family metallopeptidase n=1 Tax=Psychromicrobium lacuslunae TaxID=1618207 RepID=UPI000AFC95FC|nr:M23 family metallopeptidase [Psychromicrobium lacuslunae]
MPWLAGHRGVDLAASQGSQVLAPANGVISFAGLVVDRLVITVDHQNGLKSSFEPVESSLPLGTAVKAGDQIGRLKGAGHCSSQDCLHWGVRSGENYLNPLLMLGNRQPSVLLPLVPGG